MRVRVISSSNGNYVVVQDSGADEGEPLFVSGFGPLVFSTEARANSVASAFNAEVSARDTQRSLGEVFNDFNKQ